MKNLTSRDIAQILARRDARYDGRLYFGVTTTGIYCRPVCPARPKPENVKPFRSLSEAERAGFRPCLRCRPDFAPGSALFDGTASTVSRALRLIEASDEELSVAVLAGKLGMTDRHLRRLFDEHLGSSPVEILQSHRLHFAQRLLRESSRSVSDIAFASGFKSLRRFNEAFQELYKRTPSSFRDSKSARAAGLELSLSARKPYDAAMVFDYFVRHEIHGVEVARDGAYTRFLRGENGPGALHVEWDDKSSHFRVRLENVALSEARGTLNRLRHLLDTDHNPVDLPKGGRTRGLRVPGAFDGFETAVTIILGQLISTEQAGVKIRALVETYGEKAGSLDGRDVFYFPTPSALAEAPLEKLGMPGTRAGALRELARLVASRELELSRAADLETTRAKLLAIRGIGPWTVEMIAMRCLGDPDAYPDGDLIIRRAVEAGLGNPDEWIASRAYFAQGIWKDFALSLSKKGKRK